MMQRSSRICTACNRREAVHDGKCRVCLARASVARQQAKRVKVKPSRQVLRDWQRPLQRR